MRWWLTLKEVYKGNVNMMCFNLNQLQMFCLVISVFIIILII